MISHAIIACMAATKTNMKVRKSQRTACFNGGINLPVKAACPVVIVPAFDDNTHEPFHFNNIVNDIAVAVNDTAGRERALDMMLVKNIMV